MSNYYHWHCKTCDSAGSPALNHQAEELTQIWNQRAELVRLHAIKKRTSQLQVSIAVSIGYGDARADLEWVAVHTGHDVVVRDEYGADWGMCSKKVLCVCGNAPPCALPKGHEGAHKSAHEVGAAL